MLRQARKNGITLDELFSTSYPSNKQTPAQKIISMYSERRGGSKYKPKRSRAPNRSKPRKRSKCAKFSKSMCNNNSKKHVDVFGEKTPDVFANLADLVADPVVKAVNQ